MHALLSFSKLEPVCLGVVFFVLGCYELVVGSSVISCLEELVSEVIYCGTV